MRFASCLLFLLVASCDAAAKSTKYYAAAAQMVPIAGTTPLDTMRINLGRFAEKILQAKSKAHPAHLDIMSFPEDATGWHFSTNRTTLLPYCETWTNTMGTIPCNQRHPKTFSQQYSYSCLAQESNLHLVINVCDLQPCNMTDPHCPPDGMYLYNTDVAFGPDGSVLAKYHKTHLFDGSNKWNAHAPSLVTFTAKFGVTFGMFICFDILFPNPAAKLHQELGITDFVTSAAWDNIPPVQTAPLTQAAWSYMQSSNLVAANTGWEPRSGGGGVYAAGSLQAGAYSSSMKNLDSVTIAQLISPPTMVNPPEFIHSGVASEVLSEPDRDLAVLPVSVTDANGKRKRVDATVKRKVQQAKLRRRMEPSLVFETQYHCSLGILAGNCTLIQFNNTFNDFTASVSGSVSCGIDAQFRIPKMADMSHDWALAALDHRVHFPYTPEVLHLVGCYLVPCFNQTITSTGEVLCGLSPIGPPSPIEIGNWVLTGTHNNGGLHSGTGDIFPVIAENSQTLPLGGAKVVSPEKYQYIGGVGVDSFSTTRIDEFVPLMDIGMLKVLPK